MSTELYIHHLETTVHVEDKLKIHHQKRGYKEIEIVSFERCIACGFSRTERRECQERAQINVLTDQEDGGIKTGLCPWLITQIEFPCQINKIMEV